jgi:hypothetical protein
MRSIAVLANGHHFSKITSTFIEKKQSLQQMMATSSKSKQVKTWWPGLKQQQSWQLHTAAPVLLHDNNAREALIAVMQCCPWAASAAGSNSMPIHTERSHITLQPASGGSALKLLHVPRLQYCIRLDLRTKVFIKGQTYMLSTCRRSF